MPLSISSYLSLLRRRRWPVVGLLAGLLTVAGGCEHADPLGTSGGLEPTLTSIQANILDVRCALPACHGGPNPQRGLNLSAGNTFASAVGVRAFEAPNLFRVDPGNPDDSYLVMKIEGSAGIVGDRMPRGAAPLSTEEISTIREWITSGALDN